MITPELLAKAKAIAATTRTVQVRKEQGVRTVESALRKET
jgi:hypothetical protein